MNRVAVARTPGPVRIAAALAALEVSAGDERHVTGVAIDVLRATSTLTVARAAGAAAIVPFAEVSAALAYRDAHPGTLACGERGGAIVPGFDLGNSPFEYTPGRVAGRTLAFASTNGSRAMLALAGCGRRWLAAFVCMAAVIDACASAERVLIACAGELGEPSPEDSACAAWLMAGLVARGFVAVGDDAESVLAMAPGDAGAVREVVIGAPHGRALAALGTEYVRDVEYCATLDGVGRCFDW